MAAFQSYRGGSVGQCSACRHFDLGGFTRWVNSGDSEASKTLNGMRKAGVLDWQLVDYGLCTVHSKLQGQPVVSNRNGGCNSSLGILYEPVTGYDRAMDEPETRVDLDMLDSGRPGGEAAKLARTAAREAREAEEAEVEELRRAMSALFEALKGGGRLGDATREAATKLAQRAFELGSRFKMRGLWMLAEDVLAMLKEPGAVPSPKLDLGALTRELEQSRKREAAEAVNDLVRVGKRVIE